MPGIVRTRVGYTGGSKKNPAYQNPGDHTEAVQIDYDPGRISYADLLYVFWKSHNPAEPAWSRQYMPAVYFHDKEQKKLAEETRAREEERLKRRIFTEILPASDFYKAEDYHQKYRLRLEVELMKEFRAMYPSEDDFRDSTAAARVNGYLTGYGTINDLTEEIDRLGLSPEGIRKLLGIWLSLNR